VSHIRRRSAALPRAGSCPGSGAARPSRSGHYPAP
jgi:hypothetical protein